jgi:16S rRNA processing protein RimM
VWRSGEPLGVVDHLIETGANPVLVVNPVLNKDGQADADPAQTLIPFVAQYIVAVDLEARRIEVNWGNWDEEGE